ncbi:hypothetical protein [Rhodococcus xishaensis]|nr:hypothetical protein [Rhodococcus xishaensis]
MGDVTSDVRAEPRSRPCDGFTLRFGDNGADVTLVFEEVLPQLV